MPDDSAFSVAHAFDPDRLRMARELRGLSKVELATKVGKSPSALTQFENGSLRPDAGTVRQFALALGVPVHFLGGAGRRGLSRIELDQCHFRSLRSARQRDRRSVLATGSMLLGVLDLAEEHVELPEEDVSRVAAGSGSPASIEDFAAHVRREWGKGLGPLPGVISLLEAKGVAVLPIAQRHREIGSFSFWYGDRPCVFLVLYPEAATRTRWDAAHELGHLLMHEEARPGDPALEREADRFAASFLLPRETFEPECPTRLVWPHFRELKARWGVSLAALLRRAHDLGRLSEASYRRAFVQLNRTGERFREEGEPEMERPEVLRMAIQMMSEDGASSGEIAESLGIELARLEDLLAPALFESAWR